MCSMSSWIQAATVASTIDVMAMARHDGPDGVEVDQAAARSTASAQREGDDRERRRGPGRDQRQAPSRARRRSGAPPRCERDRAEPDGHGQGEGQVGQPEDDRWAASPPRSRPIQAVAAMAIVAGHDRRPQDAASRPWPPSAPPTGTSVSQRSERAAGRRGQDRQPRVGQGQRQRRGRPGSRA